MKAKPRNKIVRQFLLSFILSSCSPFGGSSILNFLAPPSQILISSKGDTFTLKESSTIEWDLQNIDAEKIQSYEISVGTDPGDPNFIDWIDVGLSKEYKFYQRFEPLTTYYVNLRYTEKKTHVKSKTFISPGYVTPMNHAHQISISDTHACAVSMAGDLKCWGANDYGQLGYEDLAARGSTHGSMAALANVHVGIGRTVKRVSVGLNFTCAILDTDELKCWGDNTYAQLGYDDYNLRGGALDDMRDLAAVNFGGGRTVMYVASGPYHSCAILDDESLRCWGGNWFGQLGYDNVDDVLTFAGTMSALIPVNLGAGRKATSVAIGLFHTCAILDGGEVKCWGANYSAQLGTGDFVYHGSGPGQMAALPSVNLGVDVKVRQITAGATHTCALTDEGKVKCWGASASGQLGNNALAPVGYTPAEMAAIQPIFLGAGRTATELKAGSNHTCAMLDTKELKCWGSNDKGQLGYNDTEDRGGTAGSMLGLQIVDFGNPNAVSQLALGGASTCIISENHDLKCWGSNDYGQLGYNHTGNLGSAQLSMRSALPIDFGSNRSISTIEAQGSSTCAILDGGELKCWGYNAQAQLGYNDLTRRGDTLDALSLIQAVNVGAGRTVKQVKMNSAGSCVILDNDQLKCWGYSWSGLLGYDDTNYHFNTGDTPSLPFVNLGPGRTAKRIGQQTSSSFTCVILDNDQVKCFGLNNRGQLGIDGTASVGHAPGSMVSNPNVNLGVGRTAKSVALGGYHACAILDTEDVKCWGWGADGRTGLGSTVDTGNFFGSMSSLPTVNIGPGRTAKKIATGLEHTCVILDDGKVKCWGLNTHGRLGLGDTATRGNSSSSMATLPTVNLGFGHTAKEIAAGERHTCVILDNDKVKCWGWNGYGQLGYSSNTDIGDSPNEMEFLSEVNLGDGRTAKKITTGSYHTCAQLDNDTAKCWGNNNEGQLGVGDTVPRGDGVPVAEIPPNLYVP